MSPARHAAHSLVYSRVWVPEPIGQPGRIFQFCPNLLLPFDLHTTQRVRNLTCRTFSHQNGTASDKSIVSPLADAVPSVFFCSHLTTTSLWDTH